MNERNELLKEVEERIMELASETEDFRKTDFFKSYLDSMSKFWKYSYHNQLLIYFAMPKATQVAGFHTWNELGRKVKKGSKAIKILAPYKKTIKVVNPETLKEEEKGITLFFPVSVFDVSDTEGRPLPEIDVTIEGDSYGEFLSALLSFCKENGIEVDFKHFGVNGLYGYSTGGQIMIAKTESINTQVNTLIHEIAHELLHKNMEGLSRQQKEIQAEGTAYVVTKHFGLENKSFNYLALYDADHKKIMDNLKAIADASKEIIGFLEGSLFIQPAVA